MLGAGLQATRGRGEDRFYNPAKARRANRNQQNDQLRRAQSDSTVSQSPGVKDKSVIASNREPDNRVGLEDPPKPVAVPAVPPMVSPLSNLERFLESIPPSVPAQYLSKTTIRSWKTCDVEYQPYFVLGDLWESFKEWSVYGAGVPLILNDCDSVVQYYVPYLSGIQIYVDSIKPSTNLRQRGDESDSDFRDSSSDNSSDSELERRPNSLREQHNHHILSSDIPLRMDGLSLRDQHQEDFSSDEGESVNSRGRLLFEYLEYDRPYSREPLADKISDLASRFPELRTLRSCDLLPQSWVSVAWYPIYRIPTGPTLKDLDACFLTYHSLHTPVGGMQSAKTSVPIVTYPGGIVDDVPTMSLPPVPIVTHPDGLDVPMMSLPVLGLASYKFKGSLWTPNEGFDRQLASSLLQTADNWLRALGVQHPDFLFFLRR